MYSKVMQSQKLNMVDGEIAIRLFKIFPTRIDAANWASQHGYDLSSDDGYPRYGIVSVDINPGEYELKE